MPVGLRCVLRCGRCDSARHFSGGDVNQQATAVAENLVCDPQSHRRRRIPGRELATPRSSGDAPPTPHVHQPTAPCWIGWAGVAGHVGRVRVRGTQPPAGSCPGHRRAECRLVGCRSRSPCCRGGHVPFSTTTVLAASGCGGPRADRPGTEAGCGCDSARSSTFGNEFCLLSGLIRRSRQP